MASGLILRTAQLRLAAYQIKAGADNNRRADNGVGIRHIDKQEISGNCGHNQAGIINRRDNTGLALCIGADKTIMRHRLEAE